MAKHSRRKGLKSLYEKNHLGCIARVFHFFDFHQRFYAKRNLLDRRHGGKGRNAGMESPEMIIPCSSTNGRCNITNIRNSMAEAPTGSLESESIPKQEHQLPKVSEKKAQLTRTCSMHHCNDFVFPEEIRDDSLCKTKDGSSFETKCVAVGCSSWLLEKHALLEEKLNEAKTALFEQRKLDATCEKEGLEVNQANRFLGALELFNDNMDIFLRILQNPNILTLKTLEDMQRLAQASAKSSSFQRAISFNIDSHLQGSGCSRKDTDCDKKLVSHSDCSKKDNIGVSIAEPSCSTQFPSDRHDCGDQRGKRALSRFKSIQKLIKDAINESKAEIQHISLDGILHKIPYGHGFSKKESVRNFPWRSSLSLNRKDKENKQKSPIIKRSHSLLESLDKYCQLYDSSFKFDSREGLSEKLQLTGDSNAASNSSREFERIHSLPGFELYGNNEETEVVTLVRTPSTEVESDPVTSSEFCVDSGLDQPVESDAFVMKEGPECHLVSSDGEDHEKHVVSDFTSPLNVRLIYTRAEDVISGENQTQELAKPIVVSVADADHLKCAIGGSARLVTERNTIELDPSTMLENLVEISSNEEFIHNAVSLSENLGNGISNMKADEKDDEEFHYVKDIIEKSGINGNDCLGWYSVDQPVNPSLFVELEGSACDLDDTNDFVSINLNHLLLFDLINETILEIKETSLFLAPWLKIFSKCINPVPYGSHLLEEVWSNISWHLSFQPEVNPTLDCALARDLQKDTRWMNLAYESDFIITDLEESLMDDLLDETTYLLRNSGYRWRLLGYHKV